MAPEVMVSGNYNTAADIFSFGIVISEAIAGAEEEDIIDETRTPQFGLDVDKIKALLFATSGNNNKIGLQLVDFAAQCCQLDPKKRPTASQIVGSFQLILLEYQTGRLRHHVSNMDASVKAEVKAMENQASEKIFGMADKDGDGYLCFEEFSWLARASNDDEDERDLTRQDFTIICEAVGAESSRGLSSKQLQKVYTKLRAGDALEDWLILHARGQQSPPRQSQAVVAPPAADDVTLQQHPNEETGCPIRSQTEVCAQFSPILKKEGKIYQKSASSRIRKATKGEHVVTTLYGVQETQQTVKDDTSWMPSSDPTMTKTVPRHHGWPYYVNKDTTNIA